jgi:hypothetical protein
MSGSRKPSGPAAVPFGATSSFRLAFDDRGCQRPQRGMTINDLRDHDLPVGASAFCFPRGSTVHGWLEHLVRRTEWRARPVAGSSVGARKSPGRRSTGIGGVDEAYFLYRRHRSLLPAPIGGVGDPLRPDGDSPPRRRREHEPARRRELRTRPPWMWTNSKAIWYGSWEPRIREWVWISVGRSAEHRGAQRGAGASERGT